ncbi:MAG: hypothetical protein KGS61_07760 [Verrucomicrobia bacterium]|nr:hypothetical protein [Verrucomicrobiota bacterium]
MHKPLGSTSGQAGAAGPEDQGWIDFRDQCRRQMRRPLDARIQFGFCRMYKPVLDDAPWRAFDTMAEYRAWCATRLPAYLGFRPAAK